MNSKWPRLILDVDVRSEQKKWVAGVNDAGAAAKMDESDEDQAEEEDWDVVVFVLF